MRSFQQLLGYTANKPELALRTIKINTKKPKQLNLKTHLVASYNMQEETEWVSILLQENQNCIG